MTYAEKLKDPCWQKKRLEVLDRDDFTCQHCHSETKTLHVHHLDYLPDREPWDYPIEFFLTLCESCHEEETIERPKDEKLILRWVRLKFKNEYDRSLLFNALSKLENIDYIMYLLRDLVDYPAEVEEALKGVIIRNKQSNLVQNG